MLKRVDDLLAQARLCSHEGGEIGAAGETIMSWVVLHLKSTLVDVPENLQRRVRLIEQFCKEK